MSKSLGNFVTIKDFINKHSARILRFLVLKNHYRSPIDHSDGAVLQAEKELERIDEFVDKLSGSPTSPKIKGEVELPNIRKDFNAAMEDDFNTLNATAVIFELITRGNTLIGDNLLAKSDVKNILEFFREIDRFFGFIFWPKPKSKQPLRLLNRVEQREKYREYRMTNPF